MNDFDYDVMQKKRLARGARAKKNGSRTRYVGLPSDHLTRKEREELNGPVKTYTLNEPVSYAELKSWPEDIQKEYLMRLQAHFNASQKDIAEMLGCGTSTAYRVLGRYGLTVGQLGKKHLMGEDDRRRWESWIAGEVMRDARDETDTEDPEQRDVGDPVPCKAGETDGRNAGDGVPYWDRLYREGRLLVLPVALGTPVYELEPIPGHMTWRYPAVRRVPFELRHLAQFGRTIFLTADEAFDAGEKEDEDETC